MPRPTSQSAEVLEAESGYVQEPALAGSFRQAILGGRWSEAIHLLSDLGVVLPEDKGSPRRNSTRRKSGDLSSTRATNGTDIPKIASSSLPDTLAMPGGMPTSFESVSSIPDIDMDSGVREPPVATGSNFKKQDTPGRRAIFMVLRQKYLELIEAGQTVRALKVLRLEVAPAAADTAKLHALSG